VIHLLSIVRMKKKVRLKSSVKPYLQSGKVIVPVETEVEIAKGKKS